MSRTSHIMAMAFFGLFLAALPVLAATITVTTTDDENNSDGDCALREAVRAANNNVAVDACTAGSDTETDTIVVPAGIYTLTLQGQENQTALFGDLDIIDNTAAEDLVIAGAGATTTIIQACTVDQLTALCPAGEGVRENVFQNLTAHFTIVDVTIRNGFFTNGSGGGIRNDFGGVVTVNRCIITANRVTELGGSGGGIYSATGAVNVIDSTIINNVGGNGAGIENEGPSVLTVTGSTISGNSGGGGIVNRTGGTATVTNSTISGNSAARGAGISSYSLGFATAAHLDIRNSTITNNTSIVNGQGTGGVYADAQGITTVRNSIIAGNIDVHVPLVNFQVPDCGGGGFISEGYNLIGNNAGCPITPVVGDQIGTAATPIDALLGPLADNGGGTLTHLLLAGSPAISAGNPAAPGSGGVACPPTDQRGVARPQGTACDPGAVEVAGGGGGPGPLQIAEVKPPSGGNTGSVLTLVYGTGIVDGASIKLTRSGQPDIEGKTPVVVSSTVIATQLDLEGVAPGTWDVVVTNPDMTSVSLPGAFTVVVGGRAEPWVEIGVGRAFVLGRASTVVLTFGNRGTVDAYAVPLWFSFPDELEFHLPFAISPPPAQPGQIAADWTREAVDVPIPKPADRDTFPLLLPIVPAGSRGSLRFRLKAPPSVAVDRLPFTMSYDIGRPFFDPDLKSDVVALFVERAKAYATQVFGTTTFPTDAAIEQYVRTQLALLAGLESGEAVSRIGAPLEVYSLAQLVVDVGQFAAGESETIAAAQFDRTWLAALVPSVWLGSNDAEARIIDPDCDPTDVICESPDPCEDQPPVPPCAPKDPPITKCDRLRATDKIFVFAPCRPNTAPVPGRFSKDPNDKIGPNGPGGFTDGLTPIPYTVLFENLSTATAPALEVAITDHLDVSKLDLATFSLGPMHFGGTDVFPPPGLASFTTDADLRPGKNLLVRIVANLDAGTGIVSWHFTALDPATGELPEDPLNGFLPPNVTSPEGEGGVQFTISPKAGLGLGTSICNAAHIVFDLNAPIDTPEWCNVIGTPEDCGNCRDDDGDGLVDRADPDCVPAPANGGGAGLADPDAAKALDKCAKGIRKTGGKLAATRAKMIEACLKAVTDCVQLKPGDAKCLTGATAKCSKAKASLVTADTKGTAAIAKVCAAPAVAPADLAAATGIGFAGEAGICAERGVAGVGTLDDVTACIRQQHACAAAHLIAAAVPRAGELLALGGWDDLPCIDQLVNAGGAAVAPTKRKALRKCDLAIQKATATLGAGRAKALQACGAAVFSCVQAKPGDAGCLTKASGACAKVVGGLPTLGDKFTAAIAKTCGVAPLAVGDLLAAEGLGAGALADTCTRLGVPTLASVGDVSNCLAREVACRADQTLRNETPRFDELLNAAGVSIP